MYEKNLTSALLADSIGVQRSSISHILSGRNKPSIDFIQKLLDKYPSIDSTWLITGNYSESGSQNVIIEPELPFANADFQPKSEQLPIKNEISHSQPLESTENKIEKIVIFYSDKTFTEYSPQS